MSEQRVRAYVALGANVGDAPLTLAAAVRSLQALPRVALAVVSPLYATRPVGVEDQADFHNAVVGLDVPPGPDAATGALALLIALKQLEHAFGRQERARWGPRELDLDLITFGDARVSVSRPPSTLSANPARGNAQWLDVPHPSAADRLFVLAPLADIAPDLVPAGWHRSVSDQRDLRVAIEGPDAVRRAGTWNGAAWTRSPGTAAAVEREGPAA